MSRPAADPESAPSSAPDPAEGDGPDVPSTFRGLTLDPFQLRAVRAIHAGRDVLLAAPTGAGKTVVAEVAITQALEAGKRAIYTSPIKALSNQKYRDFGERFPGRVGLVTGDVSLDQDAPVLIMTTEIFRNTIVDEPERYADVAHVIFDEVHYIDDADRGTVWEESIILAPPQVRMVALSATIPNARDIADWIAEVREAEIELIIETTRPVPLEWRFYAASMGSARGGHFGQEGLKKAFDQRQGQRFHVGKARKGARSVLDEVQRQRRLPLLYFAFNRKACEAIAWKNRHRQLLDKGERERLGALIDELVERYDLEQSLSDGKLTGLWRRGLAYHHAGMLPTVKEVVERLFTAGLIKMLFATETFAVGVNMPASAVVFDALEKFDGVDFRPLKVLELQQMAGRAGRRGMDKVGYVHVNLDALEKVDYRGLQRLLSGKVEVIKSQLNMGYSTILNLRARLGIEEIHEVAARSLGRFQDMRQGDRDPRKKKGAIRRDKQRHKQLDRKLDLLAELSYLDEDGELTARGRFAAQVQGFELHVAELFFGGELEDLDEHELSVVFAALIFEAKKSTWFSERFDGQLRKAGRAVSRRIRRLRQQEARFGIEDLSKPPDFQIGGAVYAWSRGASLADIAELTSLPDGDLVRTLRLAVQLMRQARQAAREHPSLAERLQLAVTCLKRDEADAEAQLRVS